MDLEALPNEIFLYHIFPFFSWEELYQTFLGLNQRFNQILRSLNRLKFTVNAENKHHPALTSFSPWIACLSVCLGEFDLTPFSALRWLYLQYPSLHQRNFIRPANVPFLEYLQLSYPFEDRILLNLIFSNKFEHLKSCQFDRTFVDHSWTGSPKLHSLSISVSGSYGTICILRACPNLVRLNMIVYYEAQPNISPPPYSITAMNSSLRHLFIRSEFQILPSILTCTPHLNSLIFDDIKIPLENNNPDADFKLFAGVLSKLRQLVYLHCTIGSSPWHRNISFQSLHPLFRSVTFHPRSHIITSSLTAENQ